MLKFKKCLQISWSTLYVGLKNDWLTAEEVVNLITQNSEILNCEYEVLISINVNDDHQPAILEILKQQIEIEAYNQGTKAWQLIHLMRIEKSDISIHDKLKEIELLWSMFDYPESWRDFIYYLPSEKTSSEEGLYQNFVTFMLENSSC